MLIRIVSIVFPLFAVGAFGYAIGRYLRPHVRVINKINLDFFLPVLAFSAIVGKNFHVIDAALLAFLFVVVVFGVGLVAWCVAPLLNLDRRTLLFPTMFTNSGTLAALGLLAFGPNALAYAIILFTVSNLLHFTVAAWVFERRIYFRYHSSLVTLALALIINETGVQLWAPLQSTVDMIGNVVIPLLLVLLGIRIADMQVRFDVWSAGLAPLAIRMLVGLAIALPLISLFDLPPQLEGMVVLFSTMPAAVSNYVFAERYRQEPEKVASMVIVGNVASIAIIPVTLFFVLSALGV